LGLAAVGLACGGNAPGPGDGGSDAADDVGTQPFYGAVIPDSGFDAPSDGKADASDGQGDTGSDVDSSGVALYGAPPPPKG
jgi:hypothetical protein